METPHTIDLTIPAHAYFFGFVQGDGHLACQKDNPNKGKLEIELSIRDEDILQHFHAMFPEGSITYRHRATNFAESYDSVTWRMCRQGFREQLEWLGVPVGSKSLTVEPPKTTFSVPDYWRGLIDADGSLGVTGLGLPFVSLVTTSEVMARAYETFLAVITGKQKHTQRNVRDQAFNIMVTREDAVKLVGALYYPGCLALNRKTAKAAQVVAWVRPVQSRAKKVLDREWEPWQDAILMSMTPLQAQAKLGRSKASVGCRKARLMRRLRDSDQSAEGAA